MPSKAIYPGSFDPIPRGHINIIERASRLFEQLTVGIAHNNTKKSLFTVTERVALAQKSTQHLKNVRVVSFEGLLVDFAHQENIPVILRGLRNMTDFDFEFQLSGMNRQLHGNIETVFLSAEGIYTHLSSSLIKAVAEKGRDVTSFVNQPVADALLKKYKHLSS